jgi:aminocarboxymuconate-semialdehyde decarboxylase
MTNRRQFFKDAAAVVFTSCGMLESRAHAQASAKTSGKRREVSVGGKRVRTIDIHAHCMIPEAQELMGRPVTADEANVIADIRAEKRLQTMDEWGIDVQALSINPTWYGMERDIAARIMTLQNQKLAELCEKYPDRFVAFAAVALQYPELAAQQLEEGVKKYRLKGAAIGGHVNDDELSDPKFDVFWRKAEELGCLIFMHPQGIPEIDKRLSGKGGLTNVIGNPLETTIFLEHLIYEGTLDRFPGLKICAAHGGGYFPSYAARSDYGCARFPDACATLKKKPSEYLRQVYVDSMVFTAEGLRHLVAECGAGQIMIGTDYPYAWSTTTVNHVLNTPGLSNADKRAILGETAARLLI